MRYITGVRKILFTAPHAVRQVRPGYTTETPKPRDLFTGELAAVLAESCAGQALIATGKTIKDPNWYISNPFRQKIQKLIGDGKVEIVIDLHGAADGSQPHEVIVRGNKFASKIVRRIANDLGMCRFSVAVGKFRQDAQLTISEWLEQEKIPSLALELTLSVREHHRERFIKCFSKSLREF